MGAGLQAQAMHFELLEGSVEALVAAPAAHALAVVTPRRRAPSLGLEALIFRSQFFRQRL